MEPGVVFVWALFAAAVGALAHSRGRSGIGFFLLSALLSPLIGFIVVLVMSNKLTDAETMRTRVRDRDYDDLSSAEDRPTKVRSAPQPFVADEIAKLADLLERGVITTAEFETQKSALLTPLSQEKPEASMANRSAVEDVIPKTESDCIKLLGGIGYKAVHKPSGWHIKEPLGGNAHVETLEEFIQYSLSKQNQRL